MNKLEQQAPSIHFLNHASFVVDWQQIRLVCDPWFSGKVFNDSWELVCAAQPDNRLLTGITHIWISHEHPDHLHFPTLRRLKELNEQPITVLYRQQANKNVIEAVAKLGFKVLELQDGVSSNIGEDFELTVVCQGTDSALLIKAGGKCILNQNDTVLGRRACQLIKSRYPKIDVHFCQFSLAGYYGNEGDHDALKLAHDRHVNQIKRYYREFEPSILVPFASFVSFAKVGNAYLNRYRVKPQEVFDAVGPGTQLLYPGDQLLWHSWTGRNRRNLESWNKIWEPAQRPTDDGVIADADLQVALEAFCESMNSSCPGWLRPRSTRIKLPSSQKLITVDLKKQTYKIEPCDGAVSPDVTIGDSEFLFFMKFPWGADTLNITANLTIHRRFRWLWFAYFKHAVYVLGHRPKILIGMAALMAALSRGLRSRRI